MAFRENTVSVISTDTRRGLWQLKHPVVYDGRYETFIVPAGFGTDFATIPQPLRWLVGRTGAHTLAAVLHDWLVTAGIDNDIVSHRDADGLFRRVLREAGVPFLRRWVMRCGVRYGSLSGGRCDEWWRDAPAALLITTAAIPVVLPPTILTVIGASVYTILEGTVALTSRAARHLRRRSR